MRFFEAQELEDWCARLLECAGVPDADARVIACSLVNSNLCGHDSHGVLRLPQYLKCLREGLYHPGVELRVQRETSAMLAGDAQWGLGQVQAHRLLDLLEPKARAVGAATGTLRNCGHVGRLGEYAERATEAGMMLVASVNNDGSGQRVAPPGGIAPRLGTNPLCVGIPTTSDPLVVDFGTCVVAEGKVRAYYLDGKKPVPEGWLLDAEGRPTTDSRVLYEPPLGSILPIGASQAYKGFGLALALDVLTGGLSGGRTAYEGAPAARGNCVFFLLIDPSMFVGDSPLRAAAAGVAQFVRSSPCAPGVERITLPGDPERATREARRAKGIPIPDEHWRRLLDEAERVGLAPL
jgi:uncharacterized oxidoreductase